METDYSDLVVDERKMPKGILHVTWNDYEALDRMSKDGCGAYKGFLTVIDGNGTFAAIPGSDIASNTIL